MAAEISVVCGNVDDGTGDIRAKIDAVHIRVDGASLYNADGSAKRYRLQVVADDDANEPLVRSGASHRFTPDANGDHQWDGYIFPIADDYTIELYDETAAGAPEVDIDGAATVDDPTEITVDAEEHGLTTGDTVVIDGTSGYTPDIDGTHIVTVTGANTFTIDVEVTVAGSGGSVVKSELIASEAVTAV